MNRLIAVLSILALSVSAPLLAADAVEKTGNVEREVKVGGLSERTYKSLTKVHEMIGEELYTEAYDEGVKILGRVKGNLFEEANVAQTLGHISSAREDFDQSIKYFQQAVDLNSLPNRAHFDMMFSIAQLYVLQEKYDVGLRKWAEWASVTDEIKPAAYVLKASAHAQQENYRSALEAITKAIDLAEKPQESWYNLALASNFELKDYPACITVLETMVRGWPEKKKYWSQLASLQLQQKRDKDALATLSIAHRKGLLDKQADFLQLFNLYGFMKIPYKAGEVLNEGLEKGIVEPTKTHYEQLASAWFSAKEFDASVNAYKEAAKMALDGKVDQQIAYIEAERENWDNVMTAAAAAVEKGGLNETDQGNMYLLLGMASWEKRETSAAREAFRSARKYNKTRQAANEWLNLIEERLAADAAKAQDAAASG